MNSKKILAALFIFVLGISLVLAQRGLSSKLPSLFPHSYQPSTIDYQPLPEEPVALASPLPDEPLPLPPKPITEEIPSLSKKYPPKFLHPISSLPLGDSRQVSYRFEISSLIEPIVNFWVRIYAQYNTHQVVFHDSENLEIQYSVLDFSELDDGPLSDAEKKSIRSAEIDKEIDRIAQTYPVSRDHIRTQTGLKNRFLEGIQRSGRYLPYFEQIFQSYGVPKEITRLVFVESMFNEGAYSKVGAAGLWQFMPSTARRYMTVDRLLDERYDPLIATHGAARLFLKNYETLGSWSLAINAYNSGAGNLLKAMSVLGTQDIAQIIKNYRGGSYAFASRNFFPCFLAALTVYENRNHFFGKIEMESPLKFDLVKVPVVMSFDQLASWGGIPLDQLKDLNPGYRNEVFGGNFLLPPGAQVRIPAGQANLLAKRFYEGQSPTPTSLRSSLSD